MNRVATHHVRSGTGGLRAQRINPALLATQIDNLEA
jgi:hypothetical protein